MLLGWPAPENVHMQKNEMARLSGKNPASLDALGPGAVTYAPA
jgi:hypothetical protein